MANRSRAERTLRRLGQTVDVINRTKTGSDDYGENYTDDAPVEVYARVDRDDASQLRDALGADAIAEATVYVPDSTTIARAGGGDGATKIDVDQDGDAEYVVVAIDDQDNGLLALGVRRRTDA